MDIKMLTYRFSKAYPSALKSCFSLITELLPRVSAGCFRLALQITESAVPDQTHRIVDQISLGAVYSNRSAILFAERLQVDFL